ncbi:alkylation response protein AidB-like acyl-CoA dehydrogenase [Streptomyces sp. B3I7]|nr:alkylation response protein AidB-like acyl-CoA dehydrogenase [Streptomyces sp. B3I7]
MSEEDRVPVDPLTLPGKLRASIEAAAEEMDAKRGLPGALVAELRASGIFRLHTPRELGGAEASSVTVMRVYEELARIDASVAWVVANGNAGLLASRMEQAGIDRIWGTGTEPIFANSTGRPGPAIPVEGGYRVSGHYKVISGIGAADWLWVAVVNVDDSRDVRYAALPREDWSVQDTWDTTGARGTGSHDVLVEDAFVPSELAVDLSRPTLINRPVYRGLARRFMAPGASAVALGVAQQAIEEIILLAPTKRTVTVWPNSPMHRALWPGPRSPCERRAICSTPCWRNWTRRPRGMRRRPSRTWPR